MQINNKPSKKKSTIIQVVGGLVNNIIQAIQGIVLVPLYLKYLGSHTYGLWLASGGILFWLNFVEMGFGSVISQKISKSYAEKKIKKAVEYFMAGFLLYLFFSIFFFIVGYFFSSLIPSMLNVDEFEKKTFIKALQISVFASSIGILNTVLRTLPISLLLPSKVTIIASLKRILIALSIVAFLLNNYGLVSIPYGALIGEIFALVFFGILDFSIILRKKIKPSIEYKLFKELFSLSPYLFLSKIANVVVQKLDSTIITIFISPEITTLYVIGRRAGELVLMITNNFAVSLYPSITHLFYETKKSVIINKIRKILNYYLKLTILLFSVYFTLNKIFILLWVGNKFLLPDITYFIISLSFVLESLNKLFLRIYLASGNIKKHSIIVAVGSASKLILMILFLKIISFNGIPLSAICSFFITILLVAKMLNKINFKLIESAMLNNIITGTLVFAGSYLVLSLIGDSNSIVYYITGLTIVLLLNAFLFLCFDKSLREDLLYLFKKKRIRNGEL